MRHSLSGIKKGRHSDFKIVFEKTEMAETFAPFITDFVNWEPPFDLYVIDDTIIINMELPGVKTEDILIYVARYFVIVSGTKENPVNLTTGDNIVFHNFEISYGRFERRIDLPLPIEIRRGKYLLENGILTIKFPVEKERIIPIEDGTDE
ncbi:MAG: Hsp20/alpha crystallin family protein [candidate division WOR-3 bacterium]